MKAFLISIVVTISIAINSQLPVAAQELEKSQPPETPVATETLASLKRLIHTHSSSVESIHIRSRGSYADPNLAAANAFYQVTIRAKAPYFLFHDSAHGHDSMDWELDPKRQVAFVRKNDVYNEYVLDRMFFRQELKPEAPLPGSLQSPFFFRATGLWPTTNREAPKYEDLPFVLKDIAASTESHLVVRPQLEKINGRWCHVLEHPGIDTLWIDTERGGCLLRRELREKKTGRLLQRLGMKEHRELAPRIWLPHAIDNTIFHKLDPKQNNGKDEIETTATTRILEIAVNGLHESDFEFTPRPGSLQIDGANPTKPPWQVTPGGLEQVDNIARWIKGDHISTITADNPNFASLRKTPTPKLNLHALLPILLVGTVLIACESYLRLTQH